MSNRPAAPAVGDARMNCNSGREKGVIVLNLLADGKPALDALPALLQGLKVCIADGREWGLMFASNCDRLAGQLSASECRAISCRWERADGHTGNRKAVNYYSTSLLIEVDRN